MKQLVRVDFARRTRRARRVLYGYGDFAMCGLRMVMAKKNCEDARGVLLSTLKFLRVLLRDLPEPIASLPDPQKILRVLLEKRIRFGRRCSTDLLP
jgi:hypothetical protein